MSQVVYAQRVVLSEWPIGHRKQCEKKISFTMRIDLWAFKVPKIVSTLLALSVISITFRFYFGFV